MAIKEFNMITSILKTDNKNIAGTVLRVFLALVVFPHGAQKLLGWFGGYGFSGTMNFFTDTMNLPWLIGFLVIVIESVGALMLFFGFLSRVAALGIFAVMLGALLSSHLEHGFFMNWFGNQAGEGIEFFLLTLGMAAATLLQGGGRFSVDGLLVDRPSK